MSRLYHKILPFTLLILSMGVVFLWFFIALYEPSRPIIEKADVLVIFGAGYNKNQRPVPALEYRLMSGIELWNAFPKHQKPKIIISGRSQEVQVMRNFLIKYSVPNNSIIEDPNGINTILTVANTKKIMNKEQFINPVFISQAYHLPRIWIYVSSYRIKNAYYFPTIRSSLSLPEMLPIALRETCAIVLYPITLLFHLFNIDFPF